MTDPVQRSDELDKRIAGSAAIETLTRASRRNLVLIRLLAVSLVLDAGLSIGLGVVAVQAQRLAGQANSLERQQRATCLAGNEARAGQRQLWHHALEVPPATPRTPAQQEQVDQFGRYVDTLFAPRTC